MSHIFGPVPSRRLGRSLGIDLVPFKTCSYDCVYCQLGLTTNKTITRQQWTPIADVLEELKEKIDAQPDYITLSGSGEPTLCTGLGALIEGIRAITNIPVAVLTNSSLLWREDVREELAAAHLVVPSLDAGDAQLFYAVNRPHPDIRFETMAEGLVAFREQFTGALWLEVFVLGGYTADVAAMNNINAWVKRIKPDRVQINTVTRPPAEDFAISVDRPKLEHYARLLEADVEIIAAYHDAVGQTGLKATRNNVLAMLERRPCTVADISHGLGIHRNETLKYIEELLAESRIEVLRTQRDLFYTIRRDVS